MKKIIIVVLAVFVAMSITSCSMFQSSADDGELIPVCPANK